MNEAIVIAAVAAAPPTLAALLAYTGARAAQREAAADRNGDLRHTVATIVGTLDRVASTVERVEGAVGDLRERVASLEATPRARAR